MSFSILCFILSLLRLVAERHHLGVRVQVRCHQGKHFGFLHMFLSPKSIEVNLTQFRKKSRYRRHCIDATDLLVTMAELIGREKAISHVEEGKTNLGIVAGR
jgi:hypothetical protein